MYSDVGMNDSYVGRKLTTGVLMVVVVLLAISLIKAMAYGDVLSMILTLAFVLVIAWSFLAREYWWFMLPATVSFGGFFYFGFRLMLYEIGLVLCFLPLVLSVATSQARMRAGRKPASVVVYLLLAYLTAHCAVSLLMAYTRQMSGLGTLLRVYMQALWPLVFIVAFHTYGRTRALKHALQVMYVFALARAILGTVALSFPDVLYVPGINFVLPATTTKGTDLRFSALLLVSFGLCNISVTRSRVIQAVNLLLVIGSSVLVLFGAGRIGFLMYVLVVLIFLVARRQYAVLVAVALSLAVLTAGVNVAPESLYRLPKPMRRTLSCLVLSGPYHTVHEEVEASNEWHFQLIRRGRHRWLESPRSFFLGNRILPYNEAYSARSANLLTRIEIAVDMGAYESGLWTVLACTGVVGAVLYVWLFVWLLRGPLSVLRRDGIRDYRHAFYFVALSRTVTWVVFCWIAGHFPADELMFAGLARAAYEDEKDEAKRCEEGREDDGTPGPVPPIPV